MKLRYCFAMVRLLTAILVLGGCQKNGSSSPVPEPEKISPYLTSGYYSLRQVGYSVDAGLNLEVTKNLRIEITPQTIGLDLPQFSPDPDYPCESHIEDDCGKAKLKPLRTGSYILRYALVRNSYDNDLSPSTWIAGGEIKVEVISGNLITDLPLKLKDLRAAGSRNHLLLEITAIDKNTNLRPHVFETTIDSSGTARMIFHRFDLAQLELPLHQQILAYKPFLGQTKSFQAAALPPVSLRQLKDLLDYGDLIAGFEQQKVKVLNQNYAFSQNLVEWPAEVNDPLLRRSELVKVMRTQQISDDLYRALCYHWNSQLLPQLIGEQFGVSFHRNNPNFSAACLAEREHGFEDYRIFHMLGARYEPYFIFQNLYQVTSARVGKQMQGRNFVIQIGDKFYVRSRNEYNFEAGFRPLSLIPIVGKIFALAGVLALDASMKNDSGNEIKFSTDMQINVEENTMAVDFHEYRRCMIVRMNPAKINDLYIQPFVRAIQSETERDRFKRAFVERGIFVCDSLETQTVTKLEKYYYLYSQIQNGYQQDPTDARNRQISLPLRGERDFRTFMEAGKSRFEHPESTSSDFLGMKTWSENIQGTLLSLTPSASGIYLDQIFY